MATASDQSMTLRRAALSKKPAAEEVRTWDR